MQRLFRTIPPKLESRRERRRRLRRFRRRTAALVLLSPVLWILLFDAWRRLPHLLTFDRLHAWAYVGTAVASAILWAVLLGAAVRGPVRQPAAGLFVTLFTLAAGGQGAFHGVFNIYCSHDAQIYSRSIPWSLVCHLPLGRPKVIASYALCLGAALVMVCLARRWVKPRRWTRAVLAVLVPVVLAAVTQIPASYRSWQSTTPDLIYVHGLVSVAKEHLRLSNDADELRVQRRAPANVPAMTARPARARNVLFILQESLRYDVVCNEPTADPGLSCATPFSNAAVPKRYPLHQLRANAATTAISISNLWSGIGSHEGLDTLLSVPLLWDYAHAAGYHGAYWTSQNVMFGSMRLYVQDFPVDLYAYGTNIETAAHYDAGALDSKLTDWVIRDWDELEEPFFAVVHYSNVHFPYVYDEEHAPFQPAIFSKAPEHHEAYFNYYKDVVYLSDMAVGRLLEHVRASERGERTVILYTSDHGESFREHWQLGHTSSLYDEEIKVPGWIDAPPGTLSPEEEQAIAGAKHGLVWHYDFPPTILDLLGIWDAPEMAPFRAKMIGSPITRPARTTRPVPLSNCSWLWECGFRNWGMMLGPLKVEAREWDDEFHCFDVLADPEERVDLGERACAPLPELARDTFGPMPFQEWPVGENVLWGPAPAAKEGG